MDFFEKLWENTTGFLNGVATGVERSITAIFGSSNARYLKRIQPKIEAINALEPKYQAQSDAELRSQTFEFRRRLAAGQTLDDILVEAFAVCREGGRRWLGMRHYDVQLVGGMVLHAGAIAEMITGEGKTLVATLPAYLNALEGRGVHVVTVNDYLARRDMEWMGPLYIGLGLTVGAIQSGMNGLERQKSYACDITYGTNNEFGFDYLRDNMKPAMRGDKRFRPEAQQSQGPLHYAIIDEVDNILIDEARTPLIISGEAHDDVTKYSRAEKIARQLIRDTHFEVKEKEHNVILNDEGVRFAEKLAGVESFYTAGNMEWPHLIDNSLKAHHLYKRDVNYVVQPNPESKQLEVVIVDEFTGRLMPGRQWSDGLHQAIEAKENVPIKKESQTLATITLQNYFKLYKKICGMTGTAMTEANEFWKIYKLDVIAIPSNRTMQRINYPDVVYLSEQEKYNAVAEEIERIHKWDTLELTDKSEMQGEILKEADDAIQFRNRADRREESIPRSKVKRVFPRGRPVLVGTVSIENSEKLSRMLEKRGIKHQVLNAKHHQREAEIVSQAGRLNAVTIATNMAGRGTDIILGGNPETMAWAKLQSKYPTRLDVPRDEWDDLVRQIEEAEQMKPEGKRVKEMGGLHIVGTERHESRRIDLQLRGRCGRQGDPGTSRFYLSLEDDLMRKFGGEWVKGWLQRMGMQPDEAIESRMVTRRIEGAQKKVEERNFDIRKNLLEYDELMDQQRKAVYGYRQRILSGENCRHLVLEMLSKQIHEHLETYLNKRYGPDSFAKWAGGLLAVELQGKDFVGADLETAVNFARDEADRLGQRLIQDAVEENLPEGADPEDWNWQALCKFCNSRWGTNLQERELKQIDRDDIYDRLVAEVGQAIQNIDLTDGDKYLQEDYGARTACAWAASKFGIQVPLEEVRGLDAREFAERLRELAEELYATREVDLPVRELLGQGSAVDPSGQLHVQRELLAELSRRRFNATVSDEEFRTLPFDEIRKRLWQFSHAWQRHADNAVQVVKERLQQLPARPALNPDGSVSTEFSQFYDFLQQETVGLPTAEELAHMDREIMERQVLMGVEMRYRPEIRYTERRLVLQMLDDAWKNHLLAMDHLRSSVNLRGYAQVDPKVEYKREGQKLFEQMWRNVGERITDTMFKLEVMDESEAALSYHDAGTAIKEEAPTVLDAATNNANGDPGDIDAKVEPIRNTSPKVGRNDPCPCGSGKKYKHCHGKGGAKQTA
ncbi:MAG: SEC-C metal-binding domain-containing protein [Pirellulales bacterium]|nr:SEC-C metal-binding domain-containing protein [Pirellulales bacterium]